MPGGTVLPPHYLPTANPQRRSDILPHMDPKRKQGHAVPILNAFPQQLPRPNYLLELVYSLKITLHQVP
jgi:hypothetical protein